MQEENFSDIDEELKDPENLEGTQIMNTSCINIINKMKKGAVNYLSPEDISGQQKAFSKANQDKKAIEKVPCKKIQFTAMKTQAKFQSNSLNHGDIDDLLHFKEEDDNV